MLLLGACQGAAAGDDAGATSSATGATDPAPTTSAPVEPSDPTTSTEPTEPHDHDGALPDVSDAVVPECGGTFALPERVSELVVDGGPPGALPDQGGGWTAEVTSAADEVVQGYVTFAGLVVVDDTGAVVAAPDPGSMGAEGSSYVGVAAGASMPLPLQVGPDCRTGDWLPTGDYEAYAAVTFVAADGGLEQAQGGPWPVTIGGGDSEPIHSGPEGVVGADVGCGEPWSQPQPGTDIDLELIDQIRTPRPSSDDIDGRALVRVGQQMQSVVWTEVVVLSDGVRVNRPLATDATTTVAVSPGTSVPSEFGTDLLDCSESSDRPLAPGDYEVLVGLFTGGDGEGGVDVVAVTEPVTITLR